MPDKLLETSDLALCKLFQGLNREEIDLLYQHGEVSEHKPGDVVVHEAYHWENLYVILSGEIEVFLPKTEHRFSKIVLTTLGASQTFGEFSFIDAKPASASVATIRNSTLFSIQYQVLKDLLDKEDQMGKIIYKNLLLILVEKLRTSNEELDVLILS